VVTAAGCGLPEDDGPQAIAPENLPADLLDPDAGGTSLPPNTGSEPVEVFLLEETPDGPRLVAVQRDVEDATQPGQRLLSLLSLGATEEDTEDGLQSVIPPDTELLSPVVVDEDTSEVVVDLSSDILNIEGPTLPQAFAQIVYTVTGSGAGDARNVRFLVEGRPISVLDGDGAEQEGTVSRSDYSAFDPRS
jgi:spore germination protein GerM